MALPLLEKLQEFGVAESIFNRCAEQGLCTLDDLLNVSEGMLRALGILKGSRVKITSVGLHKQLVTREAPLSELVTRATPPRNKYVV